MAKLEDRKRRLATAESNQSETLEKKVGKSSFGRVRLAGRSVPALPVGLAAGLVISLVLGMIAASLMPQPMAWGLKAFLAAVALFPTVSALAWVLCVDRSTVEGADQYAEENVENRWVRQAAQVSYLVCLILVSLAALVSDVLGEGQLALALFLVAVGMVLIFGLVYVVVRFGSRG
ncbi:hypothetical protein CRD60_06655 [Bifidobacterium aemilianum]|uniref:DUF2178 domain-containing protein n=1 Tax=Bifidobacterium aemilianum TaxID=2493120 RepID=A0A366K6S8_9BIFI|nr:hypothetical protein [Bifidobacterium aemilianum]RBP97445.1 hypothetical protein CRD60_06655 [Bifidobacterium aemilianum]